ncbi:hypothetical protein ACFPRL_19630 [Pseudoclavibacter helvolus]
MTTNRSISEGVPARSPFVLAPLPVTQCLQARTLSKHPHVYYWRTRFHVR